MPSQARFDVNRHRESIVPIYEYTCGDCGREFETLVRSSMTPECPACHSHSLHKKLSVTAATGTTASHVHAGPCGSCGNPGGPGSCALNWPRAASTAGAGWRLAGRAFQGGGQSLRRMTTRAIRLSPRPVCRAETGLQVPRASPARGMPARCRV